MSSPNSSLVSGRSRVRVPQPAPLYSVNNPLYYSILTSPVRRALSLPVGEQTGTERHGNARDDAGSPQKVPKVIPDSFSALLFLVLGGE